MTEASDALRETDVFSDDRLVMLRVVGRPRLADMKTTALILMAALLLVSACGTPASSTGTSSATASPVASPAPSLGLTPTDFVLPPGCSYIGKGVVDLAISTLMSWEVDCGAAPDLHAIEKLTPAFAQQGWTVCFISLGRGVWAKGTTQTLVGQSAVGYPTLSQLPRQTQDCPLPTAYVNSLYKFSLELPVPYRNSALLSLAATGGQRPAGQDAFTARTDADEATVAGTGCQTACPIWNYVAVVTINMGSGSQTPRQWYSSLSGAVGETIEDTTLDGRQAVKITNGVPYPLQYIVKDGDRMFRIAMQYYTPSPDMAAPAGASTRKLEQILTSFHFTP
ncbi:MAG: hypothetical protein M3T56_05995 [Chloroflexota bacterium]|nr:hypothetical protein [Chloroflexota bacterium]